MTTKAPDQTMTEPNFASADYAEQWQRGKRLRGELFVALTEMMLDLANIQLGDRVLADRARAWSEIEQHLSQFEGLNGFEAPGEWLIGAGTK